jgi:hypothetical protein
MDELPSIPPPTHTQVHETVITQQISEFLIFQAAVKSHCGFPVYTINIDDIALICINEHIYKYTHFI